MLNPGTKGRLRRIYCSSIGVAAACFVAKGAGMREAGEGNGRGRRKGNGRKENGEENGREIRKGREDKGKERKGREGKRKG